MKSPPNIRALSIAELAEAALRPAAELSLLLSDPVYWGWGLPHGDGRPVLVLPGLYAGDYYLRPLRDFLARVGYSAVQSGIARNPGWSHQLIDQWAELAQAQCRAKQQRVTIIGHSMGGLQARAVAARAPAAVQQVIALGSPLAWAASHLPGNVRMTAIYSREDRIVVYPASLERDPRARNIEVAGSHIGLAFNPAAYRVLARVLNARDPAVSDCLG